MYNRVPPFCFEIVMHGGGGAGPLNRHGLLGKLKCLFVKIIYKYVKGQQVEGAHPVNNLQKTCDKAKLNFECE